MLVARRLRRPVSIAGAMFLVAVTAAASIYPKPAETVVRQSAGIDIPEWVRSATSPADAQQRDRIAPRDDAATDTESPTDIAASVPGPGIPVFHAPSQAPAAGRNEPVLGRVGATVVRALRTESIPEMQVRLYGPQTDLHLLLINPGPPYTSSGPGNYQLRPAYVSGSIEHSLFETGQAVGLSDRLILKLAEIFGWDVDLALDVRAGDNFSAIYEEKYWFGRKVSDGQILAAEFINRGRVYRAIGFPDETGRLVYYTPDGHNLKRTFLRTPVAFSRVSSGYSGFRYHPILKLWRAHTGIDYAAPVGTPVRATATGTIAAIGWNGGYGRTIIVEHDGPYSTLYAHLSRYRSDLRVGAQVAQGETIGYVGRSGLATGPHLHYEFRVNGRHQNPMTYEFPDGDLVAPDKRAEFLHDAHEWIDQLNRMTDRLLASR